MSEIYGFKNQSQEIWDYFLSLGSPRSKLQDKNLRGSRLLVNLSQELPVVKWETEIRKEKWPMKKYPVATLENWNKFPLEMMTNIVEQISEFSQHKDKDNDGWFHYSPCAHRWRRPLQKVLILWHVELTLPVNPAWSPEEDTDRGWQQVPLVTWRWMVRWLS